MCPYLHIYHDSDYFPYVISSYSPTTSVNGDPYVGELRMHGHARSSLHSRMHAFWVGRQASPGPGPGPAWRLRARARAQALKILYFHIKSYIFTKSAHFS